MTARLWITGVGAVTSLGDSAPATWERLVRGDRVIDPITVLDGSAQRVALAAEVPSVTLASFGSEAPAWSRTSAMARSAASEAMKAARLDPRARRVGLVVGGTTGGMLETEQLLARLHAEPASGEPLRNMLSHPLTATGDRLGERLGPFSRVRVLSSACSSGANALVVAAAWLLAGEVDAVVAGGSDGLCRLTLSGFNALCAIDPEPCRPFHRLRRGTSLGEGAGFVVLERADTARLRGQEPLAELAGWALGSEAHHITNPAPDGRVAGDLVARAVGEAGFSPDDVDYVNAHGTGTPQNDAMEAAALARAFGHRVERIPVSSSKGQIGHTLGAAGAIEAVITALVVAQRVLVPTAGLDDPDPALKLRHVPHVGERADRVRVAVSNAFGFGGMDTVLVFSEPDAPLHARPRSRARLPVGATEGSSRRDVVVTGGAVYGTMGRLGARACAFLPSARAELGVRVDPDGYLDAGRARRLDRTARLGAVAVCAALEDAALDRAHARGAGLVLGSAFGNVDACAAFMHRIFERGPRSASPAEFPNLVPSSPAGHVSIYAELHGPALATADLAVSGESAFAQAWELVLLGEAQAMVAGGLEPSSAIADRVLSTLFAHGPAQAGVTRPDLAVALVLESASHATERGAKALARVVSVVSWVGDGARALAELVPPGLSSGADRTAKPRSEVILARATDAGWAAKTAWHASPALACAAAVGQSDALGAVALVVAAARLGEGLIDEALVLGVSKDRGYAIVLASV